MLCDLVGSTAMTERLDPEDVRDIIMAYQQATAAAVARYGGVVARFVGDGVLCYFGYPTAHEDDAERAVRAALDLADSVPRVEVPSNAPPLSVRIGIATGFVVAGDLVGERVAESNAVVGITPNLAARLQEVAQPNTVVIGEETHALLGGLFEFESLGVRQFRGIENAQQVWRVTAAREGETRYNATRRGPITPLVGRDAEMDLLRRRWALTKNRSGQFLVLAGDPGIGKSRLIETLREHANADDHRSVTLQCSAYHEDSAFYPVIQRLIRFAGIQRDDDPAQGLNKLAKFVGEFANEAADAVPLLAELLGIPVSKAYPPLDMSPELKKERTVDLLVEQLLYTARSQPVLLIVEDAHWIDPSSLDLLQSLAPRIVNAPVMTVVSSRLPVRDAFSKLATVRRLERLDHEHSVAVVRSVPGGVTLSSDLVQSIADHSDGVPLYMEELTRSVLEHARPQAVSQEPSDRQSVIAVPTTLQDSLMARLDQLGPGKRIAQVAAVAGREFTRPLLRAISGLKGDAFDIAIRKLLAAGVLVERGSAARRRLLFRHALIQDAAYKSLVRSRRREIHAEVGNALEQLSSETARSEPEVLAHHFTEAGIADRAIDFWLRAGQLSRKRLAFAEATHHLNRGLECLAEIADPVERLHLELALRTTLGPILMAIKGYGSQDVVDAYARARELCEQAGESPRLFPVLFGLWSFHLVKAEYRTARDLAAQMISLSDQGADTGLQVEAHGAMGVTQYWLGQLPESNTHLSHALSLYDPVGHATHAWQYGQDPMVACSYFQALVQWLQGDPDSALITAQHGLSRAETLKHHFSIVFALQGLAMIGVLCRNPGLVLDAAVRGLVLAREQRFPYWIPRLAALHGWALVQTGQTGPGLEEFVQSLDYENPAQVRQRPFFSGVLLADVHMCAGNFAAALEGISGALEFIREHEERWCEPELLRLRGECLRMLDRSDSRAEECFESALELAREQGARSWELRAAISLARFHRNGESGSQARKRLAASMDGFDTARPNRDIHDARSLLSEST